MWFKHASGLSWAEIARRLGTYPHTVWRWTEGKLRPNVKHMLALLEMAGSLGLAICSLDRRNGEAVFGRHR